MQRTIQCPLPADKDLLDTIKIYNHTVQHVIDVGWALKTFDKSTLHVKTYKEIREKHRSFQSSLVQCARDMASDMLERERFEYNKPVKQVLSGVRYNQRTFTPFLESGMISISTIRGRKRYPLAIPEYFQQYLIDGRITSLTLYYNKRRKKIIAFLVLELPDIPAEEPSSYLGVDRGIKRVAVCSNNTFYPTNHILAIKWKYQQLRKSLQSKGTRSQMKI